MRWFDIDAGIGTISSDASENGLFFNFTAIPGEGYCTLKPGAPVKFELVEGEAGQTARNIQKDGESG